MINKRVFKIAILLSRGIKIALAPVVLSSIYRDLKEKIAAIRALSEKDHGNVSNNSNMCTFEFVTNVVLGTIFEIQPKIESYD